MKLSYLILCLFFSTTLLAELKVATYNIRNFDYDYRRRSRTNKELLIKQFRQVNADLYAVQEIIYHENFYQFVATNLPEYEVKLTKCGGAGHHKLGFIYRKNLLELEEFIQDERLSMTRCHRGSRPAAIGHFRLKGSGNQKGLKFTAINLHLKAGNLQQNADYRARQYELITTIRQELGEQQKENLIVIGDMNTTDYNLRNHNHQTFVDFVEQNDLTNLSRDLGCSYYWWGGRGGDGNYKGVLVDHILISNSMLDHFSGQNTRLFAHCQKLSCQNSPYQELGVNFKEVSDHCPMMTTLK